MKRDELIKKWLDNELSPQELEAFKTLEDYADLVKLGDAVSNFKTEDYDSEIELNHVLRRLKTQPRKNWIRPLLRVAAILILCFSVYFYTTTRDTTIQTLASNKTTVTLPDASQVSLNALSSITYNKKYWNDARELKLEGEAYFKVSKGSKFKVQTLNGVVTVLGTQFNVKQRDNYFEVICFEGAVSVSYNSDVQTLKPGDQFLILDGKYIPKAKENSIRPYWLENESHFESVPYVYVLAEFERQYNVTVEANSIDTKQRFTGNFAHDNLTIALKAITLPLHLTYSKINKTIKLTRE